MWNIKLKIIFKKWMWYWEKHFQRYDIQPLPPLGLFCHLSWRVKGLRLSADIKILPFSWQIRENLFREAHTGVLVYGSWICCWELYGSWICWVFHRAFAELHPCFPQLHKTGLGARGGIAQLPETRTSQTQLTLPPSLASTRPLSEIKVRIGRH